MTYFPSIWCETDLLADGMGFTKLKRHCVPFTAAISLGKCTDLAVKHNSEGNPRLKLCPVLVPPVSSHCWISWSLFPLAPVLANLLKAHHEKIWLEQYEGPEVSSSLGEWHVLFISLRAGCHLFVNVLQYTQGRFTMEKKTDHACSALLGCFNR